MGPKHMVRFDKVFGSGGSSADIMSLSGSQSGWKMRYLVIVAPLFCFFVQPAIADELSELKERLQVVDEERQNLRKKIRLIDPDSMIEEEKSAETAIPGQEDGIKSKASVKFDAGDHIQSNASTLKSTGSQLVLP